MIPFPELIKVFDIIAVQVFQETKREREDDNVIRCIYIGLK